MSKTIVLPFGSSKQSRYAVDVKNVVTSASSGVKVKGATSCCNAEVGSRKYCKECDEGVPWKAEKKMFEFGGETHVFEASRFDDVLSVVENTDIEVKAVLDCEPANAKQLYSKLAYVNPSAKFEKQFAELRDVIRGKVLVVEFVERQKNHQGLLYEENEAIHLRYLHDGDLLSMPNIFVDEEANAEVVALKRKILSKATAVEHNLMEFHNTRAELEEQFFDAIISGKEASVVSKEVIEEVVSNDLDELRSLAED